jgi:hypothetical protein
MGLCISDHDLLNYLQLNLDTFKCQTLISRFATFGSL